MVEISSGKRPPIKQDTISEKFNIPLIGASNLMGYTNEILYNEPILVIGRVGTLGIIQKLNIPCWTSDNTLVLKTKYYEYIFQILNGIDYQKLNRGSTQPLITQNDLKNIKILFPTLDILTKFEEKISSLMKLNETYKKEINFLNRLKNLLLPKLMNGEINVENIKL